MAVRLVAPDWRRVKHKCYMSPLHPPVFAIHDIDGTVRLFFPDGTPVSREYALERLTGFDEIAKLLGVKVNYRLKWLLDVLKHDERKEAEKLMRGDIR